MSGPRLIDLRRLSGTATVGDSGPLADRSLPAGAAAGPGSAAGPSAGADPAAELASFLAACSPAARLAGLIAAARLVCFPTDTVYGVGGLVTPAVARAVTAAKGRDAGRPLQVVYPTVDLLEETLALSPQLREAVRRLLPGPFTLLLPHPAGLGFPPPGQVPHRSQGTFGVRTRMVATMGVRVPQWPAASSLLAGLPYALLASSANISGEPAPRSLDDVDPRLMEACDLALDAGPVGGQASAVLDLSLYGETGGWRVLRAGNLDEATIGALLDGPGDASTS